jgi:hypothetical protein
VVETTPLQAASVTGEPQQGSAVPVTGPSFGLLALAAAAVVARDRRR